MTPGSHTAMWSSPRLTLDWLWDSLTNTVQQKWHCASHWAYALRKAGTFYFCDLGSLPFKKSSYSAGILLGEVTWREIRPETMESQKVAQLPPHPSRGQLSSCPCQGMKLVKEPSWTILPVNPSMTAAPAAIQRSRRASPQTPGRKSKQLFKGTKF